jgi:hypothetical protein
MNSGKPVAIPEFNKQMAIKRGAKIFPGLPWLLDMPSSRQTKKIGRKKNGIGKKICGQVITKSLLPRFWILPCYVGIFISEKVTYAFNEKSDKILSEVVILGIAASILMTGYAINRE